MTTNGADVRKHETRLTDYHRRQVAPHEELHEHSTDEDYTLSVARHPKRSRLGVVEEHENLVERECFEPADPAVAAAEVQPVFVKQSVFVNRPLQPKAKSRPGFPPVPGLPSPAVREANRA